MRNAPSKVALKPRSNFVPPVSPCVFYKMHEGSGLAIADSLGNGPDFTVSDGTPLATNVGFFAPPASNTTVWAHAAVAADINNYLSSLFDFSLPYSNILIGIDYELGADIAAVQQLFSVGKAATTTTGRFGIQINAGEVPVVAYAGANATATSNLTLGADQTGATRTQLLVDISRTGDNTFVCTGYVNGVLGQSNAGDWSSNSGTGPLGITTGANKYGDGFVLGAHVAGSIGGAKSALMNAAGGENSKMGRFFACRLNEAHSGIGLAVAQDLWKYRGEFPRSLEGL